MRSRPLHPLTTTIITIVLSALLSHALAHADSRAIRVEGRVPESIRSTEGFDASESAGLFVGIRKFEDQEFSEVPYAVDDAVDLAHLFVLELELIDPKKVTLALSGEPQKPDSIKRLETLIQSGASRQSATKSQILRQLRRRMSTTNKRGLFVVSMATHGFHDEQEGHFLVGSDTYRQERLDTGLKANIIFDRVSRAKAPRRLVLLDACRERLSRKRAGGAEAASAMSQAFLKAMQQASGQVVLSAAPLEGYAYDDPKRQNGVFTGAVLDGLRGKAPADDRHVITARNLAHYVDKQVRQWVQLNRPSDAGVSTGITLQLDKGLSGANLPLAVDRNAMQASAAKAQKERQQAAAKKLHERQGAALEQLYDNVDFRGPITGRLADEVAQVLASDLDAKVRDELLSEIKELDGKKRNKRIFAEYFKLRRQQFGLSGDSKKDAAPSGSSSERQSIVKPDPPPTPRPTPKPEQVAVGVYPPTSKPVSRLKTIRNSLDMEFVLISAGEFRMGSPDSDRHADDDEKPTHQVTISRPFYMGKYEVTQEQWAAVMGSNPSRFKGGDRPVESVSWTEVQNFIEKLNRQEQQASGVMCRLPTEAEWEYAARAGSQSRYHFGDDAAQLGEYAWYSVNSDDKTHPVGMLKPNGWGLYDMHGNVWEWVQDGPRKYRARAETDPTGSPSFIYRVIRGGSWDDTAQVARAGLRRVWGVSGLRSDGLGFRCSSSVSESGR